MAGDDMVPGDPAGLPGGVPVDPVDDALARARAAVTEVAGARLWGRSDGQSRELVAGLYELAGVVQAALLAAVRDLDARPDAVAGAKAGAGAATFLRHRCRAGGVGAIVAAARALDPDSGPLPELGAALAAGQVSREHVDVAVRVLRKIPTRVLTAVDGEGVAGAARVDALLAEHARTFEPGAAARLAARVLAHVALERADRFDPDAHARREVRYAVDATGMLVGSFQLDPAGGAIVKTALDLFSRPAPTTTATGPHGQDVLIGDERDSGQRRADALETLARLALHHPKEGNSGGGKAGGPLTQVLVIATPDQVTAARHTQPPPARHSARTHRRQDPGPHQQPEPGMDPGPEPGVGPGPGVGTAADPGIDQAIRAAGMADCLPTGPLPAPVLGRLACDATVQAALTTPSGTVLNLGRTIRTVSTAQRKALIARDRGCAVPGCGAPLAALDAHHITWWRHGGCTDLDNLVLLCGRHHTAVHQGVWAVRVVDGVPWVTPPTWIDPQQTPVRNPYPTARTHAETLGTHLRHHTHQPPLPPWHDPPPPDTG